MRATLFLSLFAASAAFQAPFPQAKHSMTRLDMASKSQKKGGNPMADLLSRLTNNFTPFHGHGSLENDLEEQWQAQQEILKSRRSHHLDKSHLKQKYSDPSKVKFDGKVGNSKTSEFGKNLSP